MDYQIKMPCAIDISMWEKDIFWQQLSPRPVIIIAKASEYKWNDPLFETHWKNMTDFGARRGAYHFFHANDIPSQVQTYLAQMQKVGAWDGVMWKAEFPPILDAEYEPPQAPRKKPKGWVDPPRGASLASQYKAWLDAIEAATKQKPWIYTNAFYWSFTLDRLGKPPAWTRDYKLWLAYYPDRKDDFTEPTKGMLPAGRELEDIVLWQYAEDGRLQGVPYDGVDLNWINPTLLESAPEPPSPPAPLPGTGEGSRPSVVVTVKGEVDVQIVRQE